MDIIQKNLLAQVADLHEVPEGAYNIRANGAGVSRNTTANIDIVTKTDKDGIDIIIKPGTKMRVFTFRWYSVRAEYRKVYIMIFISERMQT